MTRATHPPDLREPPADFPAGWVELILEAHDRGHIEFRDNRIRYHCAEVREFEYRRPEELVRAGVYSWLILRRGYSPGSMRVEVPVPRRVPNDYADLVVYRDATCRTPYLVVETKASQCSDAAFHQAVEQGFGYANSLRDTEVALIEAGSRSALYAISGHPHNERLRNHLGTRRALPASYQTIASLRLVAGD